MDKLNELLLTVQKPGRYIGGEWNAVKKEWTDERVKILASGELAAASKAVPSRIKRAVKEAHARVQRYAEAGLREPWHMPTPRGGYLGECYSPMDRVGVYVPGGTAPLASTAVMTVALRECSCSSR